MTPPPFPSWPVFAIVVGLLVFSATCFLAGSWMMLRLVWP